jgi:hypothetical protein
MGQEHRFRSALGDAGHQAAGAPDRQEAGIGMLQRRLHIGRVVALVGGAVERAAGIDVGAAGGDGVHL